MSRTRLLSIAAVVLGALILAYVVLIKPAQDRQAAAVSRGEAVVATTQARAAEDTVRIVVDHQADRDIITHRTEVTTREILSQPGADEALDPELHSAGVRALCLQRDRSGDPVCAALLHRDGDGGGAG